MPTDSPQPPNSPAEQNPAEPVYWLYTALASTLPLDAQSGLGGNLLYAGEIDNPGRNLLYAANIAGAASLAASSDPAVQRQAIRDGVIDFLVTSLEEALRILKNEIRKHQAVSVGVAADPYQLVAQMLDRGVLPNLLSPIPSTQAEKFLSQGARQIANPDNQSLQALGKAAEFVTWSVDRNFAHWLPRLDACAQAAVPSEDHARQRWLRLAPRYLGRIAQRQHGVVLSAAEAARFTNAAKELMAPHETDRLQIRPDPENPIGLSVLPD